MPDTYTPSVDDNGNFIDKIPIITSCGLLCNCGSRKDKIYNSINKFSQHIKCKKHKEWIESLNHNKPNMYADLEKTKAINKSLQQMLTQYEIKITQYETTIQQKDATIHYLTKLKYI